MNRETVHNALRVSPQQIDPLSWIARPWVPLSFAFLELLYGLLAVGFSWSMSPRAWVDLASVVVMFGACLYIWFATRPLRPTFGPRAAAGALVLAIAALALSTYAMMTSTVAVPLWWAPAGLAMVIAACAPYSTVAQLLGYAFLLTTCTGFASWIAFVGREDPWSGFATVVIGCGPVVVVAAGTSVFCFTVVRQTQSLFAGAGTTIAADDEAREAALVSAEISTLARLGSRVAPFLEKVADAGDVRPEDRAFAGQLARRLRSDLVAQANRSWLDSVAPVGRIYVVDPDHRADSMNAAQRSVLRGLLDEVLNDPSTDSGSLFIELRGQDDGSTAVALSLDLHLPEGKKMTMFAPYYVALKATVTDISWDASRELLRFDVPPGKRW